MDGMNPYWGKRTRRRAVQSENIRGKGEGRKLSKQDPEIIFVRRTGFGIQENWGEGSWTAKDLR